MSQAVAVRTVHVWLLRLLLIVGAASAVTAMHSLPIASHERDLASSVSQALHMAGMTADPTGDAPTPDDDEHHGLEHLCLAILTAAALIMALALALARVRRLWQTPSGTAGVATPRWAGRSPPSLRPPLVLLCVLRL